MRCLLKTFLRYREVDSLPDEVPNQMRIGSIGYSRGGMTAVFAVLYLGYFTFALASHFIGNVMPMQLDKFGSDSKTIALALTALPYLATVVVSPILSFQSDRLRSRWGRRKPYLLLSAPVIAILLVLLGGLEQITAFLGAFFPFLRSDTGILLVALVVTTVFQLSFMVPGTIFWYLFPDVVPVKYISRFFAILNLVGSLAGMLFAKWIFPFTQTHTAYLFGGIALVYLAGMLLLCFYVREGHYPPVSPEDKAGNLLDSIKLYVRECYSIKFYYWFFLTIAFNDVSILCRGLFNVLYATKNLGLNESVFGNIMFYYMVIGLVLSVPLGWLSDKFHPLRIYGSGCLLIMAVNLVSFFWVHDERTFSITMMCLGVVYAIQAVSTLPVFVAILPPEFYGQFSSANALFRAVVMMVCSYLGGVVIDWFGYQYIYMWDFIFTTLGFITFCGLYLNWQKRGGRDGYTAPTRSAG